MWTSVANQSNIELIKNYIKIVSIANDLAINNSFHLLNTYLIYNYIPVLSYL